MVLIGYLPCPKLDCFTPDARSDAAARIFHSSMGQILHPLIAAGKQGVEMVCADGKVRIVFPILAAYIADHPEQCLVVCCRQNHCPKCLCVPKRRGENIFSDPRDPLRTRTILRQKEQGGRPRPFKKEGLTPVFHPFWASLPHADIFACITPDILHQLHNGIFKTHLVNWCAEVMGHSEMDERFRCMSEHPDLRHFKNGITMVSQWTGSEVKEMEKVFMSILAGASGPDVAPDVVKAARAMLEFIYYVRSIQMSSPSFS